MASPRFRLALAVVIAGLAVWVLLGEQPAAPDRTVPRGDEQPPQRPPPPLLEGAAQAPATVHAPTASPGETAHPGESAANEAPAPDGEDDVRPSLRVEVVDGLTGRTVPATWNLGTGFITAAPFPPDVVVDEAALARSRAGVEASRAAWEAGFLPAGATREEALGPGADVDQPFVVRPAAGFVLGNPSPHLRGVLAAGVERTRVVVSVWEEAVLELHVSDPDGLPASGVEVEVLVAAGRRRPVVLESTGPGAYRVRGIPRLAGEPVRAILLWSGSADEEDDAAELEEEVEESGLDLVDPQVVSTIPPGGGAPWQVAVRLAGPRGASWGFVETDNDLPYEESFGESEGAGSQPAPASLRVRSLGWDGTPIPFATLGGEATDGSGEVVLSNLRPGEHRITLSAPGRLPAASTVSLAAGETAALTLREPVGARLRVLVTDEAGRPRPFARLGLGARIVFDVVDGEQRLDPNTDALGRRTFERVEPGRTTLRATWGSRRGAQVVDLVDGETTRVHLVTK